MKHDPTKWVNGISGLYRLCDLPQRGDLENMAFCTGWWELDRIFRFYPGQFVVVTGKPGHGKSTFMLNVIAKIAIEQGIHSFMYVPENEANLFRKLQKIWKNESRFEYFSQAQCLIQASPPVDSDESPHTIDWILDRAAKAMKNEQVNLVYIDPWNEIERAKPADMLLTEYIGHCIGMMKNFCRCLDAIVVIVAHPTKAVAEHGGRSVNLADIEGSMSWWNKADNALIIEREDDSNRAKVISAKVREEPDAGRKGVCFFQVDPKTGIFTPEYGAVSS